MRVPGKFNKSYTNVADKLIKTWESTKNKSRDYLRNPNEDIIYFRKIDPDKLFEIISKLDVTKLGNIYGI